MRVLIVGGYGTFGGRLVELLEDVPELTLLVAGRSIESARNFCKGRIRAKAQLIPTLFDRENDDVTQLQSLLADIVVDASGPFQVYGSRAYQLVEHCMQCRVNYVDLADGADFVESISAFDEAAKAAGVFALSGASSFPMLSSAAVRELSSTMNEVHKIRGGVAPSPYARVGLNVIRAVASYAGQDVTLKRDGQLTTCHPFTESTHFTIAVPGKIPLHSRRFSLVEVPDLRVLNKVRPEVKNIWIGAAPVPASLHWLLTIFAWLVRLRILPTILWIAPAMHFVTNQVRRGEHRGGMYIEVKGINFGGNTVEREWHLIAEGDDGPLIPCIGVEALIRKTLAGFTPPSGARAAMSDIDLADYEERFSHRAIFTGIRERVPDLKLPLYQRVLGAAWDNLPVQIQDLHSITSTSKFEGFCNVRRGRNPLAKLVGWVIEFPDEGTQQSMSVTLSRIGVGELWVRSTNGREFSSTQYTRKGRAERLICERFGPVEVQMALVVEGETLRYVIRRWNLFGIPMPLALGPRSTAFESVQDGKFKFDVEISLPIIGLIVHYSGALSDWRA